MSGFWSALSRLPDNPVLRREWRGLAHELGDWRVWLYLRRPRHARGWALRELLWCVLLPYGLWAALLALSPWSRQYGLLPLPLDLLSLGILLVGVYLCLMSVAVMAPSIAREREQETWETLRTTATSPHELVLGLLCGRLAPPLVVFLLLGMVWSYTRPLYAPLLRPYMAVRLSGPEIALLVWELAFVAAAVGCLALAASAWCRKSGTANAVAAGMMLLLIGGLLAALLLLPRLAGAGILVAGTGAALAVGYASALAGVRRDTNGG